MFNISKGFIVGNVHSAIPPNIWQISRWRKVANTVNTVDAIFRMTYCMPRSKRPWRQRIVCKSRMAESSFQHEPTPFLTYRKIRNDVLNKCNFFGEKHE